MPKNRLPVNQMNLVRKALGFNLALAALVWAAWGLFGGRAAVHDLFAHWDVALTMIFGSLVGGGTSEGGGAIAFPVFTKLLHIAPSDARNFSLAIQSIGMGAASVSILYLRIPIERRTVIYAGCAGIAGLAFGIYFLAPFASPVLVRTLFTVLVASLAIALLIINRSKHTMRNEACPMFGNQEKIVMTAAGFIGGMVSALVGCGENIVVFMVMVLLFRISEKVATPTSVILMTVVAMAGFALHLFFLHDFSPTVLGYWLGSVPIVVVGGPLGALACSYMSRRAIVFLLVDLIALEFVSTLLLVRMTRFDLLMAGAALLVCGSINVAMSRARRYRPERFSHAENA